MQKRNSKGVFIRVMADRICPICKKKFHPKLKTRKTCSKKCGYIYRSATYRPTEETIEKRSKALRGIPRTEEWREKISKAMLGNKNGSGNRGIKRPERTGINSPRWKGGFWITKDGYKVLQSFYTKGERIFEHRFIMEKYLCRKLGPEECIHHLNGKKLDNRIENLIVMSNSEHVKLHNTIGKVNGSRKNL